MGPSLSRKENIFLEVAWYFPCVPRGTQGKQQPQGPGRGRSGRREEDHLEEKTPEENPPSRWRRTRRTHCVRLVLPTAVGIPEKENFGVSQNPPVPSLSVCFFRSPILVG